MGAMQAKQNRGFLFQAAQERLGLLEDSKSSGWFLGANPTNRKREHEAIRMRHRVDGEVL